MGGGVTPKFLERETYFRLNNHKNHQTAVICAQNAFLAHNDPGITQKTRPSKFDFWQKPKRGPFGSKFFVKTFLFKIVCF